MQVPVDQLQRQLEKGLKPLYTIMGDEALLAQEAAHAIRSIAKTQGYTERSVYTVQGAHFNWSEVLNAGSAMSLFADKQIIEVRVPSGKPGKEGSAALQQLAEGAAANDAAMTIVTMPKLDWSNLKSAWFSALDTNGVVIKADILERRALPAWIAQRLDQAGLKVRAGAEGQQSLAFFADRVEGNLLAAHQEVQKLALLYAKPGEPVELSLQQIEQAVLNVARYDVFKLSETVLSGNALRTQRMLAGLKAEGEAEVLVHLQLAQDIQALKRVAQGVAQGKPMGLVLKEERIWGAKEALYERAVPQLQAKTLRQLLADAHTVDGIVKGIKQPHWPNDGWAALEKLALSLCAAVVPMARTS
jgi:DNA polymerase III subunit delta